MTYQFCSICGKKLKKEKGHLACTNCQFINYQNPRPTVTVLVFYKNKLLLTKRRRAPFKDWWDLPGGFVEKNEPPQKTALREIKEETGLNIKIKKLLGIYPGTYPDKFDPFYVLSIVYIATSPQEKLKALDDVIESKWFSRHQLPPKIAFDSNQKIINDCLKKIWK